MAKGAIHTSKQGDHWVNKAEGNERASNSAPYSGPPAVMWDANPPTSLPARRVDGWTRMQLDLSRPAFVAGIGRGGARTI